MTEFFDKSICDRLRSIVNSSNLFYQDSQEKKNFNFICAIMERVKSSIEYLNRHNQTPKTEDEIMLFINDAIKEILSKLKIANDHINDKIYFKDICLNSSLHLEEEKCPSDGEFFEYFRALVFAHPFETNRICFLKDNQETHYSPFLITEYYGAPKDYIGVMIYSNKENPDIPLFVPYKNLQNYIKNRYEMLNFANAELKSKIEKKQEEWKKQKINRHQSSKKILEDIREIFKIRFRDPNEIDWLIKILEYQSSNAKNLMSVQKVQEDIKTLIPQICDDVETFNYERLGCIINKIINGTPKNSYETLTYDIEKIFSYLTENKKSDKNWGLLCARNFAKQFAKKWVDINTETMSYDEIKLLTITACYLELKAEQENINEQN